MAKLKLDLHDCFNNSKEIDRQLKTYFEEAIQIKASSLEIIHGKGSGQLKKRVQRFLQNPVYKLKIKRIVYDKDNHGRMFVYF